MAKLTPDGADRLFSSRVDETDPELGSLAAFVQDVRDAYTRAPDAHTQALHLRAMAEEFAAAPAPSASKRPRKVARRAAVAGLVGSLLIGGSALAATGNLPAPAQNAVAQAIERVGLNIPKAKGSSSATGQENGDAGKARAEANRERAKEFTDDKKDWTSCVATARAQHTGPGPFDPEAPKPEGCGPKPRQQDYQTTRTNPAGNENRGKGPEPKGNGPEQAGSSEDQAPGFSQNGPPGPAGNPGPVDGPGNGRGQGQSNPNAGGPSAGN